MKILLMINLPPELEEDMVDYLLTQEAVGGFTSFLAWGHGDNTNMSLVEQVSGRRKRLQYEIIMEIGAVSALLSGLAENVGKDIFYWQQSIDNIGKI